MPFPRRGRNAIMALSIVFALWQLWSAASPKQPSPPASSPSASDDWARLEHWMNHASPPPRVRSVASSFDWSSVKLRYLPGSSSPAPMPRRRPGRAPSIQHRFEAESPRDVKIRVARLAQVRKLFQDNWESYRRFAWMKDALLPISAGSRDQFSGWAATLVDCLDTLWIMGLRDEFNEAVAAVATIDFGKSSTSRVNVFETNIRYLGGLLAAYDLSGNDILLAKAKELGNMLYGAFNTQNGMPVDFLDFAAAKSGDGLTPESTVVSASPGTLSLEMTRLSQVTGDPKYHSVVSNLMDVFYQGQNKTALPGVWPFWVSMSRQDVSSGSTFTLGGSEDSLYEYLPKMHQLLGGGDPKYEVMFKTFADTADKHFLFRPMLPNGEDILLPGNINIVGGEPVLDPETEHLACFVGGMWGLAGRLFEQPADVDRGAKLTNGCVFAYRSFPTGMMPERLDLAPCKSRSHCPWDEELWLEERHKRPEWKSHLPKGFTTAKDPRYLLRPEAIESVFYMHRITGRAEFREAAWDMFEAVSKGTRTEYANAAVLDVTKDDYPLPMEDYMESFWLAETLKYFYLIFSLPDIISLDDFVLNTEAHPFKIPK
ncbi:glycosyl hydrolase family 47 protein [Hirsutella rhossiliensis]|uniref:alpha-1,2-Mannosidase n=1 Tax=Hirsutella rhossiliensis TaxID=111463 RepID=A0A9P8N205_9HYPO|nr:glycosyl hydrolase family 47 protein [Hirsutella rhossiliensis]KAH0965394.1 glycosyl hydrolase family 47 protein [Hirsutella rhossiliensis]